MTAPAAANLDGRLAESARLQDENDRLRGEAAELRAEVAQLRHALSSRIVIEQAVGILAEKQHITVVAAFVLLRDHCRAHHQNLHDVSTGIVADHERPAS